MSLNNLDAMKLRMALDDTHVDIADEWISEVASLQSQLSAERAKVAEIECNYNTLLDDAVEMRAKVALAVEALKEAKKPEHYVYIEPHKLSYMKVIEDALAALQSTDALADHDADVRKPLEERINQLENEIHEWEESDAAVQVLEPILNAEHDTSEESPLAPPNTIQHDAEIRREVARECAEIADKEAGRWLIQSHGELAARMIRDAIRAKFGVTE